MELNELSDKQVKKLAPVAIFVYNRPVHTQRTIEALKQNPLAAHSDLIVFSDAPKSEAQAGAVFEVRKYIREVDGFKSITIVEREFNLGLARSIIDGVTSVVNQYGRIIVLEDDLIVTSHFLDFMNRALDNYENEEHVVQVSGYMFPVKIEMEEDALFLPLTTSWGWATWKRAWQIFDPDAKGYAQLKADSALRKRFNLDGAYDYYSMLEGQMAGRIDSWAVRWQLSTFLYGGLTLYPRYSLVLNAGFDGSGTHGVMRGLLAKSGTREDFVPMRFPATITVGGAWKIVCKRLRTRMSWLARTRIWIRKFI